MSDSILDLLNSADAGARKITGVVIGIVTNNQDPEGIGRVKVKFPWLSDDNESDWAPIAAPMAGNARGTYFLPEIEDQVLVAFEHGNPRFPYVLGALWSKQDEPPESEAVDGSGNVVKRVIKSRAGHLIRLDDSDGQEKVEIIDRTGNNKIIINTSDNSIQITSEGDIAIESTRGKLTLRGVGIEIVSQADIKIEATQNADVKANGQLNVRGAVVNIN